MYIAPVVPAPAVATPAVALPELCRDPRHRRQRVWIDASEVGLGQYYQLPRIRYFSDDDLYVRLPQRLLIAIGQSYAAAHQAPEPVQQVASPPATPQKNTT